MKLFDTGNVGEMSDISEVTKVGKQYVASVKIPRFSGIVFKEKKKINKKNTKGE